LSPDAVAEAAAFLAWLASGAGTTDLPLLVVAAHPDDEVIGLGAQLPRFRNATLLHVTDGAPRDGRDAAMHGFADPGAYAAARRGELLAALRLAGIGADRALDFGIPDQQATLDLPGLARRIADLVGEGRPAVLVTHSYEGGHPDHDATAFAVHSALRLLRPPRPALLEMACYHAGPDGIAVGRFLPAAGCDPVTITLSPQDCALKRSMIGCFTTQRRVLACFPTGTESLRPAPRHDFTQPPHPGRLYYENFPWGMTGERFRHLATHALRELGMGGAP
jgi:N-acetylglucosamine malate deacetylase 2